MKSFVYIGLCASLLATAAACGSSSESDGSSDTDVASVATYDGDDRQEFLETCAADEGTLVFYTAQNEDLWKPYTDAFMAKYSDISVETTRRSSGDMAEAIVQEAQGGVNKVDVISLPVQLFENMKEYYAPMKSPEFAAYSDDVVWGDDQAVTVDRTPYGLIYNTNKVAEADLPKTPEDLADARWKGEMVLSSSTVGTNWIGVMLHLVGGDILDRLGALNIRTQDVNSAALASMVAAGEASIAPASPMANTLDLQKDNAPVKWSPVTAFWNDDLLSLSTKANNPCSGMLFIDFLLSEEGQQVNAHSVSARDGVPPSDLLGLADLHEEFNPVPIMDVVGDKNYSDAFREWADLMEQKIIRK